MRSIKFRAWHEGHPIGVDPQMIYDETPGDCLVWKSQRQPLVIMQYTGLKDKNGVDIFEGDIFKENKSVGEIKYECASFFIDWKIIKDFWSDSLKYHAEHGEVIGNIYENADLLKEEGK